ncbi:rhodanese-like domain-containing protein [Sulfurospirillum sp. 1307]|jgi:rhodanese-related sulfurtransferase
MKKKIFGALVVSAMLLMSGCSTSYSTAPVQKKELHKPTAKVAKLIKKYNLEIVDFDYTKKAIGNGTRKGAKALLIDARPSKMYLKSTIPSSINIPDTEFDKYFGQLKDVKKDREILVFCGGWHCGKSPKVAGMLKAKGFSNVKLYQAGEPEWAKKYYVEVATPVVSSAMKKNSAVIIDARPHKMFLGATIPGAISIPDTKVEELQGRFPADKNTPIITFCGGYHCGKSHVIARKLLSLGYKNVKVYAGGMPAWKKSGLPTTGGKAKKPVAKKENLAPVKMIAGVKPGEDEGTVDGEWFKANYKNLKNVQIVDVRSPDEFKEGHLVGAINIEAEKIKSPKEFVSKLPKGKTIVFNCSAGARSLEAWNKAQEGGADMSKVYYFDANIECKGNDCKIEVNEPLG